MRLLYLTSFLHLLQHISYIPNLALHALPRLPSPGGASTSGACSEHMRVSDRAKRHDDPTPRWLYRTPLSCVACFDSVKALERCARSTSVRMVTAVFASAAVGARLASSVGLARYARRPRRTYLAALLMSAARQEGLAVAHAQQERVGHYRQRQLHRPYRCPQQTVRCRPPARTERMRPPALWPVLRPAYTSATKRMSSQPAQRWPAPTYPQPAQ